MSAMVLPASQGYSHLISWVFYYTITCHMPTRRWQRPSLEGGKGRLSTDPSFPCRRNSLRIILVQPSLVTLRDKPTVDKNWHLHQNYPWKYQSVLISDTLQCTEPWLLNLNLIHGRRCLLSHFKCFVSKFSNRQTRGIGESAAQVKLFNWARN